MLLPHDKPYCGIHMYSRTALHLAVCKKDLHIVDLLIDCDGGASLLMQDYEGNTPLHKVWLTLLQHVAVHIQ